MMKIKLHIIIFQLKKFLFIILITSQNREKLLLSKIRQTRTIFTFYYKKIFKYKSIIIRLLILIYILVYFLIYLNMEDHQKKTNSVLQFLSI